MAAINFSKADVMRLLRVQGQDVEGMIQSKTLSVAAYTRRGQPLFDVESVRRAAKHILAEEAREP